MDTKDRPLVEATATYDSIHARLVREAREAEQSRRPLTATILRSKAARVARAALAEELDPQPSGLEVIE